MPVAVESEVAITYKNNTITVTAKNIKNALLLHAKYDGTILTSVTSTPLTFTNGKAEVENVTVSSDDKLMVWNNIMGMLPLCKAYE